MTKKKLKKCAAYTEFSKCQNQFEDRKMYSSNSCLFVIQSKNLKSGKPRSRQVFFFFFFNLQVLISMWTIHRLLSVKQPSSFLAFSHSEFRICLSKAESCSYHPYTDLCCASFPFCFLCLM